MVAPALPGGGAGYTNQSLDNFETDENPHRSPDNSLRIREIANGTWGYGRYALVDDSDEWVFYVYLLNTGQYARLEVQENDANWDYARLQFGLQFRTGGVIKVVDGAAYGTSGKTYSAGAWYEVKFTVDWVAHTYSAWFDGDAVCVDADFSDNSEADSGSIQYAANGTGGYDELHVDDIEVTDGGGWVGGSPATAGTLCGVTT